MRKALLLLFISVSLRITAQTSVYHPFPDSNAAWKTHTSHFSPPSTGVQCTEWDWIEGDTLINGITYHKIFRYKDCSGGGAPVLFYNGYYGAIRENVNQKTVYYFPKDATAERQIYDFDLSMGDTVSNVVYGGPDNRVVFIDSILVDGAHRKRFWLSLVNSTSSLDSAYAALIEGIGSTTGLLEPIDKAIEAGSALVCFWTTSHAAYWDQQWASGCSFATSTSFVNAIPTEITISPNPSTGIFNITADEPFSYSVMDVYGREVYREEKASSDTKLDLTKHSDGIYFVKLFGSSGVTSRKLLLQR